MIPEYFSNFFPSNTDTCPTNARPTRCINRPARFTDHEIDIPTVNQIIKITFTNHKHPRLCIRHHIPQLVNSHYLNANVMDKITTLETKGCCRLMKQSIINKYSDDCPIVTCDICNK